MPCETNINWSNWAVAFATILLVIFTLFKDWIISKVFRIKLEIESINFTDDANFPHITSDLNTGKKLIYFHFKVIKKSKFIAKNQVHAVLYEN